MNLKNIMLSERTVTKRQILYDSTYMRYLKESVFIETKSKIGGWQGRGGNGDFLFNGYGFQYN